MPPKNRAARLDDLFGEKKITPEHRQINTNVAIEIGKGPKPAAVPPRQVPPKPTSEQAKREEVRPQISDSMPSGDLSSEDDDPYVRDMRASWKSNAKASLQAQNAPQSSTQNRSEYPKNKQNGQVKPQASFHGHSNAKGDRDKEEPGKIAGKYCLFNPTTKFCYKYMKDPDDRVSRRFFAADKIWNRTWDL